LISKKLAALDSIDKSVFDHSFIDKYTHGYDSLMVDLDKQNELKLLKLCGVAEAKINETVDLLASNSKITVCWAMGLTQHKNGVETIREYINLLLLKGAIGKPNAGTCPVRGHSNVQGDRSVGIMHFVNKELNQRIEKYLGFKAPIKEGYDTVEAMQAMYNGSMSRPNLFSS